MKLRSAKYITIVIALFVSHYLIGCHSVNISKYNGDGEINKIGDYFISYGYKIEFVSIDLSKPFYKEFIISNYPKIDKDLVFGILVESTDNNLKDLLMGELSLLVLDSRKEIVLNCSADLSNWIFSNSYDSKRKLYKYFIYSYHGCASSIKSEKQHEIDPISFSVNYAPKSTKIKLDGNVRVYSGGYY